MQSTKKIQIVLLTIASLVLANAASAKVLSMTGSWFMNRGPLIDIPLAGGAVPCFNGGPGPQGNLEDGCVGQLAPKFGGIPGSAPVVVDGSSFTLPTDAFSVFPGTAWVGPVAVAQTVQQLASTFTFMGPGRVGFTGNPGPAKFQADAWSNDPNQAGRLGANFTWCPGGGTGGSGYGPGVTGCAGPGDATPAANNWNGRIKYTAGSNGFGGTMAMLMGGIGHVSVVLTFIPGLTAIAHQQVGGPDIQRAQVQGAGYNFLNFNNFPAANAYTSFMTDFPCTNALPALPTGCGVITAQGAPLGPIVPSDSQLNFGMPWTTGTVTASNTGMQGVGDATSLLTAMGYDNRTALGAGRITLVAGGTTHRRVKASGNPQNYAALDVVNLNFGQSAVPAMSPMGLATAAVLMMLAVGYAFRRRLVTNA